MCDCCEEDRVVTAEDLESKIKEGLGEELEYVKAVDESDGCGSKFTITVVSSAFKGKNMLAQHRMINKLIAHEVKFIHALSYKTSVPESST